MPRRASSVAGGALALLLAIALGVVGLAAGDSGGTALEPGVAQEQVDEPVAESGDVVRPADLPPEARQTLALIDAGGPYPFDQDDGIFGNREGLLPPRERGFYREYTVVTPGEDDRGARRIVAGEDGSRWYTDDHYESFRRVLLNPS